MAGRLGPGRPPRINSLSTEQIDAMLASIRQGAFPYVAAQTVGIPRTTFYRMMALGREGVEPYRDFWAKVRQAAAEARATAEMKVRAMEPLSWLRYGPGRERADPDAGLTRGTPGWNVAEVKVETPTVAVNPQLAAIEMLAREIKAMPEPLRSQMIAWLKERRQARLQAEVEAAKAEQAALMRPTITAAPGSDAEEPSDNPR